MLHNRERLLKLLLWIRLIEWYFLAGMGIRVLGIFALGVNFYVNPDLINAFTSGQNIYLYISGLVFNNLIALLIPLFYYLVFLGISHAILYLLELKDSIDRPHPKLSPGRS